VLDRLTPRQLISFRSFIALQKSSSDGKYEKLCYSFFGNRKFIFSYRQFLCPNGDSDPDALSHPHTDAVYDTNAYEDSVSVTYSLGHSHAGELCLLPGSGIFHLFRGELR